MKISKVIETLKVEPDAVLQALDKKNILKLIKHLSDAYYNDSVSLVSDSLFDYIKEYAETKYKIKTQVGAPIIYGTKVKLPIYMGSLDKIKPDTNNLDKWLKRYEGPYIISQKLDGISALLVKENNKLHLYTRGDGDVGQDITHIIPYINIGKNFTIENNVFIRGELVMSKENFAKNNKKNNWANARNTVGGLLNLKELKPQFLKLIDFVAYWVLEPPMKQSEQLNYIKDNNINCVPYEKEKKLSLDSLSEQFMEERKSSQYEIDGLVILDDSKAYPIIKGENPDYGFAFKQVLTDQIAESTVLDILWEVSKDKYIKPKIKIEPVTLVGTTIQYATANNAKFVFDNKLGPGSRIKIIKSGDVIPKIMEILTESDAKKAKMPTIKYKWNETKVDIIATNIEQVEDLVTIKKLAFFFKTLQIPLWGEGTVKKFVLSGYDNIWKIIDAKSEDIEKIEGFGKKAVQNIYSSLNKKMQNHSLSEIMCASQLLGRGIGVKKFSAITNVYPNIIELYKKDKNINDILINIDGFDKKTIDKIVEGMDEFVIFLDKLQKLKPNIIIKEQKKESKKESKKSCKYKNLTIVCTGFRPKDIQKQLEEYGCKFTDSVSKNTDLVVAVDTNENTGKLKKAKELNIKIISKDEFYNF